MYCLSSLCICVVPSPLRGDDPPPSDPPPHDDRVPDDEPLSTAFLKYNPVAHLRLHVLLLSAYAQAVCLHIQLLDYVTQFMCG